MPNDATELADNLINEHGIEDAVEVVRSYTEEAKSTGDNYRLSVWREVRAVLRNRTAGKGGKLG
jgi:hypothetical protein